MNQQKDYTLRFAFAYAGLAFAVCLAAVAVVLAFTLPKSAVKHAIGSNGGDKALVDFAKHYNAQSAASAGVVLTKQRLVKVTHKANGDAVVLLNVDTDDSQHFAVTVTLTKSVWTVLDLNVQSTP